MKLDKKKILEGAEEYFGSKNYGDGGYGLAEECVDLAQSWVDTHSDDFGALMRKSPKDIKKELRKYIRPRVSYSKHNATFIPTFIWIWIAQAVVSWVIGLILSYIEKNILIDWKDKDENKYL